MTNTAKAVPEGNDTGYFYSITSKDCRLHFSADRSFYVFVYVLAGSVRLTVNDKSCPLEEFSYGIIRRTDKCILTEKSSDVMIFSLFLQDTEMEKLYGFYGNEIREYMEGSEAFLSVSGDFNVKQKIEELYERILRYGDEDRVLCKNFAVEIFSGIVRRMHRKHKHDEIPAEVVEAMAKMKEPENLAEGVPAMERLTGYSRSQLCRLVKKYYGKTPYQYVEEIRLNIVYNMIRYSDIDIKIIAESAGFNSISWFYKLFKRKYMKTPVELRNARKD